MTPPELPDSTRSELAAAGLDTSVPTNYGDPFAEQRNLVAGKAVVQLARDIVTVTGADRLSWLTTLSSQNISALAPGDSAEFLLLTVQGRIDFHGRVLDDGQSAWLILDAGQGTGVVTFLESMRFMLQVEIADVSSDWAVLGGFGERDGTNNVLKDALRWQDPWPGVVSGGVAYTAEQTQHPADSTAEAGTWQWVEYLIPKQQLEQTLTELAANGVVLAGSWAAEALRIAAWRPRWGKETDERSIPHELDWLRTAVHLNKGCYKGQETIARVHNLGRPPRRLVFLHLDGSEHTLPEAGSGVYDGQRQVGALTSVAQHYELGPIALALVKRNTDTATQLLVKDGDTEYAAAQEVIVSPEAGQVVGRPLR